MPLVFDRVFVVVTVVVVLVVIVVVVFADFELDCVFTNSPLRFQSVCVETYKTQKEAVYFFLISDTSLVIAQPNESVQVILHIFNRNSDLPNDVEITSVPEANRNVIS